MVPHISVYTPKETVLLICSTCTVYPTANDCSLYRTCDQIMYAITADKQLQHVPTQL